MSRRLKQRSRFHNCRNAVEQDIGEHLNGTLLKKTRTPGASRRSRWCDFEGFRGGFPRPVIRELTGGLPGNLFDKPTIPGCTLLHIFRSEEHTSELQSLRHL